LVRNWDTHSVVVEHPVAGALETGLFVPVPGSTSNISNFLDGGKDALSVNQIVSNVAGKASSIAVESIALI
jgi:hypothetical protein